MAMASKYAYWNSEAEKELVLKRLGGSAEDLRGDAVRLGEKLNAESVDGELLRASWRRSSAGAEILPVDRTDSLSAAFEWLRWLSSHVEAH